MSLHKRTYLELFNSFKLILLVHLFYLFLFYDDFNIIQINSLYTRIKQLPSGDYFVILDKGIFIYNNNFSYNFSIYNFTYSEKINSLDDDKKTTISEFKNNGYFYILCLVKDNLYLFNSNNRTIKKIFLDRILTGSFYNLMPYQNDDSSEIFNIVISFISSKKEKVLSNFWGLKYYEEYTSYFLNFYNFKINLKNYDLSYISSIIYNKIKYDISGIYFSCQIINSKHQNYLVCFYLSKYSTKKYLCASRFNINAQFKTENLDYCDSSYRNIKGIKSIFFRNDILVSFYNYYDYIEYIYDYYNNKFNYIFEINEIYSYNYELYNLNETIYLSFIYYYNYLLIFKVNYHLNDTELDFKIFNDSWKLNRTYLNYDNYKDELSLIGDFYNCDDKNWNIFYNLSIFSYTSDFSSKIDLPDIPVHNETINETESIEEILIKEDYNIEINQTKDYILENLEELVESIEFGKSYEIKGEDFTLSIKPANSSFNESSTHVDFSECFNILSQILNFSDSSKLTFFQLEINNNNNKSYVNQLEYLVYDDNKNQLDLSPCKDTNIQMYLKLKNDSLDISNYKNYRESGIDIFNINDSFFNDICHPYSNSKNDITLKDRIKDIYQNYSLCNDGCNYIDFNTENKIVSCDCKVKTNLSLEEQELNIKSLDEIKTDSNFAIIKCCNLVFSFVGKSKNIGFWIFLILTMAHFPLLFLYFYNGIKPIKEYIINEMKKNGYISDENTQTKKKNSIIKNNFNIKKNENKKIRKKSLHSPPKKFINMKSKNTKSIIFDKSSINNIKLSNNEMIEDINEENCSKLEQKKYKNNFNKEKIYRKKNKNEIKNQIYIKNFISIENSQKENLKNNIEFLPTQGFEKNRNKNYRRKNSKSGVKIKEINKKETTNIINFNLINIDLNNIQDYTPNNSYHILNNYTFEEAIKYDMRSICAIFYIFLLSKQAAFHAFLFKSPLESFSLRFCLLIFIISSDLALNAFFYLDDKISKKYKYAQNLFLFAFNSNITIILLSTLIGFIFMTLFTNLSNSTNDIRNIFRKEEEKLKKDKKYKVTSKRKSEILYEIEKILKRHKIKVIILITIEVLLMLFFWYYVTSFCHVYSRTQLSWLLDSFLSMLSRLVIEILFSLGFAKLYRLAIESNTQSIYKFVLFFYCFG